ncbi:MAG TPA: ABC transporter ATP-binding protein [Treponemataceae bacterium]|jgi:branched-chain amino acid transport system ATP-binding protein|nr:ABC transporter ATP-binding protein [Treponemataceae bacterium]
MLSCDRATMRFGGLTAVSDLNLSVGPDEIVGLIGPNGAGKTTAFNMITGVYRPTEGTIRYRDADLSRLAPHRITKLGLARTFQNIRLFRGMSVLENVLVAGNLRMGVSLLPSVLHLPGYARRERALREEALALLDRVGLADHALDAATSLPYGMQRRLEIVRALATRPSLLLLDEPAAGMNPQESRELMDFILRIREEFSLAILLIEHHMQVVMGVCGRMYVLEYGITIAEGTPEEIRRNERVIEAYLGVE